MRRGIMVAAISLLAALALAAPAGAITYGTPDGDGHPEVGALLATQAYADGTWAACSGTLISPTVFLTAAHCDLGVDASPSPSTPPMTRRPGPSTGGPGTPTPTTLRPRTTPTTSPSSSSTTQ